MAILKAKPDAISESDHTLNRVFPVTAKLTKEERGSVTEFARSQGLARGEWIRDVILRELRESVGQRSIAGRDSRGSLAPGKRTAASGRRPETHAGGVRQTAR